VPREGLGWPTKSRGEDLPGSVRAAIPGGGILRERDKAFGGKLTAPKEVIGVRGDSLNSPKMVFFY
jgi:hypothetical protein